jgi:hypothetical protein
MVGDGIGLTDDPGAGNDGTSLLGPALGDVTGGGDDADGAQPTTRAATNRASTTLASTRIAPRG